METGDGAMKERAGRRLAVAVAAAMAAAAAFAFQPIPRESAKALGVTRGKPFSSGAVFVRGKFLPPPYVVERWGTGIRINSLPVTGQIVDWDEFLKTQSGVKVERKEPPASAVQPVPVAAPRAEASSDDSALDDLFEDEPKAASRPSVVRKPAAAPRPKATASYSLEGEFVPNDATKALVGRINAARTAIDKALRSGGFICFGERYSRVTGDRRAMLSMLDALPELQKRSADLNDFLAGVRAAGLVYLNEPLCADLFRNRVDYRKLQEDRRRLKGSMDPNQVLDEASDSIL